MIVDLREKVRLEIVAELVEILEILIRLYKKNPTAQLEAGILQVNGWLDYETK
jgi:hypothetical protein